MLKDLLNPRFRKLVEQKFGVDLSKGHPTMVMMGSTTGHYNEGYAHPDSKHKLFTVLLGFTREYPYERGRLRILRSNNREDYAFEYPPEYGKMCLFKVSDKSWHGFLPQKSERKSLQFCWVDSKAYARETYMRARAERLGQGDARLQQAARIDRPLGHASCGSPWRSPANWNIRDTMCSPDIDPPDQDDHRRPDRRTQ